MRQIFFMLILSIASAPGFGDELIESISHASMRTTISIPAAAVSLPQP